jgi:hypothetical protein
LRITLCLSLLAATACTTTDSLDSVSSEAQVPDVGFYEIFPPDSIIETVMINKQTCGIVFHGVHDPAADTLAIWTIGVDSVYRHLPYPTDDRPNFYAIFTPSSPLHNHTVPGLEAYDHYHVAERDAVNTADDLVDPFIVNPGPNYDAATYQIARSVSEMNAQIAAGVLAAPITLVDAGLGPVVFHGQISCGHQLEAIWNGED